MPQYYIFYADKLYDVITSHSLLHPFEKVPEGGILISDDKTTWIRKDGINHMLFQDLPDVVKLTYLMLRS